MMKGVVVDCDGSEAGVILSAWYTSRGRLYAVLCAQFCLYFFDRHGLLVCHFYFILHVFWGVFLSSKIRECGISEECLLNY
jgi:hypothetical protein